MSKWALWAAHRYLESWVDGRTVGVDGRPLQRPWRVPSPVVVERARQRRAERPRPRWTRPLGCCLMATAAIAALDPNHPMPLHGAATPSAAPGPAPESPRPLSPLGVVEGPPVRFTWDAGDLPPPYVLRLHAADYSEVAAFGGIGSASWQPPAGWSGAVAGDAVWHWTVESERSGQGGRSPFATFEIR